MMKLTPPLWLASRSPRRQLMLAKLPIEVRVHPPDVDDAALRPGDVTPEIWVMALAYLKARRVADLLRGVARQYGGWWDRWSDHGVTGTVLGADTVCVAEQTLLGQPRDADDAVAMLRLLRGAEHRTITGVCLLALATGTRWLFCDSTLVRIGPVSDLQIQQYIASGDWRGKAGAYNLSERIAAGWPIECIGDPATVMGLPMQRLEGILGIGVPAENQNGTTDQHG